MLQSPEDIKKAIRQFYKTNNKSTNAIIHPIRVDYLYHFLFYSSILSVANAFRSDEAILPEQYS
jgi:hypothetical protein